MDSIEEVKRIQDIVDSMSSFGEKMGYAIRNCFKFVLKKIQIGFIFVLFGIFIGIFYNFIKAFFMGKNQNK